ncbi:hypothetical protein M6D93_04400 [Jatrophihabitans telluris]|uniref:Uncharacterized protein n=1 Tax=Jatrophihabitans telluris TaxID=2038343 RepID=A0ABY4R0X3_9ACTN|nr:hypothetical protein [Jatrophihabitans telluris]UQX89248.1 hypothetical protein M6D93_04400 [Jatrophihabitans telluris]
MPEQSHQSGDAFSPWTSAGADRLRQTAREVAAAIITHADAVVAVGSDEDIREVFDASEALLSVLVSYADAQFEYTGTGFPLGALAQFLDDDDDDDVDPRSLPVAGISVLQRHDYQVTDPAAVMAAGRAAFQRYQPGVTEEAAEADVEHLGLALYHVAHEKGWSSIGDADGLRPTGGQVIVVSQDEVLGPDPDVWPDDLFEEPGPRLYWQSDIYGG